MNPQYDGSSIALQLQDISVSVHAG
jgi:hypothetical protein